MTNAVKQEIRQIDKFFPLSVCEKNDKLRGRFYKYTETKYVKSALYDNKVRGRFYRKWVTKGNLRDNHEYFVMPLGTCNVSRFLFNERPYRTKVLHRRYRRKLPMCRTLFEQLPVLRKKNRCARAGEKLYTYENFTSVLSSKRKHYNKIKKTHRKRESSLMMFRYNRGYLRGQYPIMRKFNFGQALDVAARPKYRLKYVPKPLHHPVKDKVNSILEKIRGMVRYVDNLGKDSLTYYRVRKILAKVTTVDWYYMLDQHGYTKAIQPYELYKHHHLSFELKDTSTDEDYRQKVRMTKGHNYY